MHNPDETDIREEYHFHRGFFSAHNSRPKNKSRSKNRADSQRTDFDFHNFQISYNCLHASPVANPTEKNRKSKTQLVLFSVNR